MALTRLAVESVLERGAGPLFGGSLVHELASCLGWILFSLPGLVMSRASSALGQLVRVQPATSTPPGDLLWECSRLGLGTHVLGWALAGAILGLFWPWLLRHRRVAVASVAASFGVVGLVVAVATLERVAVPRPEVSPTPPPGFRGPTAKPPEGLEAEELGASVSPGPRRKASVGPPEPGARSALLSAEYDGEELAVVDDGEERGPWPYVLLERRRGEREWRRLGPFLPGLCGGDFPAWDTASSPAPVRDGRVEWIVRESDDRTRPADRRRARPGSKAWRCSVPLTAYSADEDHDGLTEMEEAALLTDPHDADTDGDGIRDGWDASPHGWYSGSEGGVGFVREILSRGSAPGPARAPTVQARSLTLLGGGLSHLHVDSDGKEIWMTLAERDTQLFRSRLGLEERGGVCTAGSRAQEAFLFGRLALADTSFGCGGLSGGGSLTGGIRVPGGRWREVFSWVTWVS